MASNSNWTIETVFGVIIFTIIAIPVWIIYGPIYIILKTIATIWQPYLYKKQLDEWDKEYQIYLEEDIYADFADPPTYGTFLGVGPWFKKDYKDRQLERTTFETDDGLIIFLTEDSTE